MRKIISFKKELTFKTKVCEITSISLEHIIKEQDDDLISGEFLINGEYKMTEGSINKEKYNFKLPFDIALNSNYETETIKLDIDNFYYEILNNEILKVNIDLLIEAKEKEIIPEPVRSLPKAHLEEERNFKMEDKQIENEFEDINNSIINMESHTKIVENNIKEINNKKTTDNTFNEITNEEIVNNNISINTNIFDNMNDNETYRAYYVYIVKEDDTIDKILDKYEITKEALENYNNIESIKPFDKIIIPTNGK